MKTVYLNIVKISLLGLMASHLGMHLLYLAPNNPATSQYSDFVETYMSSFFTQNWHLFAPEPATSSLKIAYRCHPMQEWNFPLEDLFTSHKAFPFTAKGKQTYVLQHVAREIYNGKVSQKKDSEMKELGLLQHYLQDQCGRYSSAEVVVKRVFTVDYSKRFTNHQGADDVYEFKMQQGGLVWN